MSLAEMLSDTSVKMPYLNAWDDEIRKNKLEELMKVIDMKLSDAELSEGKYYYTYWYWLFRYARKMAAQKGGR